MKRFVIVANKYIWNSNGIKTVHKICHTINKLGGDARLVFIGCNDDPNIQEIGIRDETWANPEFNTPALRANETHLINSSYVLYSETIVGNPLNAKNIIRYFGNREGYCNGKKIGIGPDDFLVAHSRATRKDAHYILFNSEINPAFHAEGATPTLQRTIDATYIGKGSLYGQTTTVDNTLLIEREWPKSQQQLAFLLRQVRCFYTWDSWSSINVEAVLCGAIPFFLRYEPWTEEDLDASELGYIPRIDAKNPTLDINKFESAREAIKQKIDALASSWDQRVLGFMHAVEAHFEGTGKMSNDTNKERGHG